MLLDACITIAYKCSACGTFEFFNKSIFVLSCKTESHLTCRCNKSAVTVLGNNPVNYTFTVPCIACGKTHTFVLSRKKMLSGDVNVFYCPETGLQQCFVGSDKDVRSRIDSLEKELDELIDMFGYDNYFKNTQVMFDALNKIHDIAEQGNLSCECGNEDVELTLFSDRIHLKCKKCPGGRIIHAASNEHLKDILKWQQILLQMDCTRCDMTRSQVTRPQVNKPRVFLRRTNDKK